MVGAVDEEAIRAMVVEIGETDSGDRDESVEEHPDTM
jgi:hypothetical protein